MRASASPRCTVYVNPQSALGWHACVEVGVKAMTFSAGTPKEVFRRAFPNVPGRSYDVGPDARRFLVLRSVAGRDDSRQPQLILNWFEELKARMRDASPAKEQASP